MQILPQIVDRRPRRDDQPEQLVIGRKLPLSHPLLKACQIRQHRLHLIEHLTGLVLAEIVGIHPRGNLRDVTPQYAKADESSLSVL
jgi:hypothetical protein